MVIAFGKAFGTVIAFQMQWKSRSVLATQEIQLSELANRQEITIYIMTVKTGAIGELFLDFGFLIFIFEQTRKLYMRIDPLRKIKPKKFSVALSGAFCIHSKVL